MTTSPSRFRKKPVVVEAMQWTGDNVDTLKEFAGIYFDALSDHDRANCDDPEATAQVYDQLHSSWMLAQTGDWIIRGVKGECYAVREPVFHQTYEAVAA